MPLLVYRKVANRPAFSRIDPTIDPCCQSFGKLSAAARARLCGRLKSVGRIRLRRRLVAAGDLVQDPGPEVDVGVRIGPGVLGLLEGVGQRAVEQVAEPAVQPDVDPAGVAEVRVGDDPEVLVVAPERVEARDQPAGGVGQVVLVVGRDVQHHVVAERVPHAELEGDGLAEVEVGAVNVVGVVVARLGLLMPWRTTPKSGACTWWA